MAYNPKWIKSTEVVKRDGTNTLLADWNIGDKRKIILDELRIQDSDGLTISDSTGISLVYVNEEKIRVGRSDEANITIDTTTSNITISALGSQGSSGPALIMSGSDNIGDVYFDVRVGQNIGSENSMFRLEYKVLLKFFFLLYILFSSIFHYLN